MSSLLLALSAASTGPSSSLFPAGWNGLAERPPLAWRSYNAQVQGMFLDQAAIIGNVEALVDRSRMVAGVNTSLWDLGYRTAGIDGGYELCVNGTMHDASGNPVINTALFPDMAGLVDHGHALDVKMGWYQNACGCPEPELHKNYVGDVTKLFELGFDGAKYDRCGDMLNSTLYAELMNKTGKAFLIEACHWGICTDDDSSSCPTPTRDWCPFNFFRTSGDVRETWNSWVRNLLTAVRFLDETDPLSGPNCWAYPDMLQVGNLASFEHDRAHFGAWAIISAPLYLSFDLRDDAKMERAWTLITNREALEVNQQWAGHPGRLVRRWTPAIPSVTEYYAVTADLNSCQKGWSYNAATSQVVVATPPNDHAIPAAGASAGRCLAVPVNRSQYPHPAGEPQCRMVDFHQPSHIGDKYCDDAVLVLAKCDTADQRQKFAYTGVPGVKKGLLSISVSRAARTDKASDETLYVRAEPWWEGAGVQLIAEQPRPVFFNESAGGVLQTGEHFAGDVCINVSPTMNVGDALLLWAKPQPGGAVAVLLINNADRAYTNVAISAAEVGIKTGPGKEVAVRDIWHHADAGQSSGGVVQLNVPSRDSAFVLLTPVQE